MAYESSLDQFQTAREITYLRKAAKKIKQMQELAPQNFSLSSTSVPSILVRIQNAICFLSQNLNSRERLI